MPNIYNEKSGFNEAVLLNASSTEHELVIETSRYSELEGTFLARCTDTGEMLKINGWNFDFSEVK